MPFSKLTQAVRAPLTAFKWPLLLALVVPWVALLFFANSCERQPSQFGNSLLTATVCIVLWTNHLAAAPIRKTREAIWLVGIALYDLIALALLTVVASIPIALFTPTYQCYTPRAKVSELFLRAESYRSEISERYKKSHSLQDVGKGMTVIPEGRLKNGLITSDGVIVVSGDDPAVVVFFTPQVLNGELDWKCSGWPKQVMPMSCRE